MSCIALKCEWRGGGQQLGVLCVELCGEGGAGLCMQLGVLCVELCGEWGGGGVCMEFGV